MKPSNPLLLADGTLRCGMYPAGGLGNWFLFFKLETPQPRFAIAALSVDCYKVIKGEINSHSLTHLGQKVLRFKQA